MMSNKDQGAGDDRKGAIISISSSLIESHKAYCFLIILTFCFPNAKGCQSQCIFGLSEKSV